MDKTQLVDGALGLGALAAHMYYKPKVQGELPSLDELEERIEAIQMDRKPTQGLGTRTPYRQILDEEMTGISQEMSPQAAETQPRSVERGTACIPCASDHFSTCAGLVSDEAIRFARREGIGSEEVVRRLQKCADQLNAMEREDLSLEKTQGLPEWAQELVQYAQNQGAKIRHMINGVETVEDLERIASEITTARSTLWSEYTKKRLASMTKEQKTQLADRVKSLVNSRLGLEEAADEG